MITYSHLFVFRRPDLFNALFWERIIHWGFIVIILHCGYIPGSRERSKFFLDLFKSFFLIVFNLHLELPSDHQENRNASQLSGCGSLGMEYIRHRFDT